MTNRRHLRLMSDYGAGWPLWDAQGAVDPSAFDISPALTRRLQAWQEHFEEHFHYDTGWQSTEDAAVYAEEGKTLRRLLAIEIGWRADVELDLWPIPAN
ncbi:hypothetical protein [Micromonospora sp. CPCC 205556]|uniref:hypothetical protein n=1 Tax=Micromonospora sp. CPCC 205556 TaxID=3122398 RepID=UPI002FF35E60